MKRNLKILLLAFLIGLVCYLWGYLSLRYDFFPSSLVHTTLAFIETHSNIILYDSASGGQRVGRSSQIDLIRSLPYLGVTETVAKQESGVTILKPDNIYPGYNLFTTGHDDEAFLVDNKGRLLHYWRCLREKIIWETSDTLRPKYRGWRCFFAFKDLDLLVIYDYLGLAKIDRKSRLKWIYKGGCHHDLWVTHNGDIYVLGSRHEKEAFYNDNIMISDYIIVLNSSGKEQHRIRILDLILNSKYRFLLPSPEQMTGAYSLDILHTNSIQVFDGNLQNKDPELFKKGNILLSVRNLSTIFIIDPEKKEIIWAWGPTNISFQHKARLLDNGNILMFDNGLKRSRVMEVNPINQKIIWQYEGKEGEPFFSDIYGSCERLPNGNTLIVLSKQQKIIEVTPEKEIVWTYTLPAASTFKAPVIYEVWRYPIDYFSPGLFSQ